MKLALSIISAFALWIAIFVFRPFNFWLMMAFATSILSVLAFAFGRPLFKKEEFNLKNLLIGIGSALFLYAVFWAGRKILPFFLPDYHANLSSIYANAGILSPAAIGLLLFFPIGFGEEIFWRGFIQKRLGFILATVIYTAIHIPTLNPVLIFAALVCGAFWGYLYLLTDSLFVVLISHMIWDPLVFAVFPLK